MKLKTAYSNITAMLNKINLTYEEIKGDINQLKNLLKLATLNIDYISNQAKKRHLLLLKKGKISINSWDKELKKVALNNCLYEILISTHEDICFAYIEHLEDQLLKMSSFKVFISMPSIKRNRRLKRKAKRILKDVIAEVANNFIMKKIPPETFIHIPIQNYFLSMYENHIFKWHQDLAGVLIEVLKGKTVPFNTNNDDTENIFHEVMLDFLEKAAKNKLTPRRSTLVNYIKGAFFNQQRSFYKKNAKRRINEEDFKTSIKRLGDDKEEMKHYEQIPKWVHQSIKDIFAVFSKNHRQLIFLKMKGVNNNKIIVILGYKNKDSLKAQWTKVKSKLKKKFQDKIKESPELQYYLYILLGFSDGDLSLFLGDEPDETK